MEIQKIGNNTFYIKGKKENVLINPSEEQVKLKKYEARIILNSQENIGGKVDEQNRVLIKGPGEYEVGGVDVHGINSGAGSTIYMITIDGVVVCFLGNLNEAISDKKIERVDEADVLIAPLDSAKLGNGKNVIDWGKKWGVNYLIPFAYDENKDDLLKFLDEADAEGKEAAESLKLTGKEELPEGMEIVVLK